jgi:hypothetical protein
MLTQGRGGVRARERGGETIIHRFPTCFLRTYAQGLPMWTVISIALSVLALLGSLLACLFAVRSAARAEELLARCVALRPYSKELLDTRLSELEESVELLANRLKMTKVRNAATHVKSSQGEPDPRVDPEGWRSWQNKQLKTGVVN